MSSAADVQHDSTEIQHHNDATPVTPNGAQIHTNGIKSEEVETSSLINGTSNGHHTESEDRKHARDEDTTDTSQKRRKVSAPPRSGLSSRAVSPPWHFGSVDKATVVIDGKRRSARGQTSSTSSPVVQPVTFPNEKRPRRESATKNRPSYAAMHNGTNGVKHAKNSTSLSQPHKRTRSREEKKDVFKKPAKPVKKEPPSSPKTPHRRRSSVTIAPSSSPARTNVRHSTRIRNHEAATEPDVKPVVNGGGMRIKLRWREPKLGRSHPAHWSQPKQHASFVDFLAVDDALEGETDVPLTEEQVQKEVRDRLRLVREMEPGGLLTEERCGRFLEAGGRDAPPKYGVWDWTCVHAVNFCKLLGKEKERHKKEAKQFAQACQLALASEDRWAKVREQKSKEEVYEEQRRYQILRYKQLVRDVGLAWENAREEVHKIRYERHQEDMDRKGQQHLDDMLDYSVQALRNDQMRDGSEIPSSARSSVGPTGSETGSGVDRSDSDGDDEDSEDSENMSESSEEEEDGVAEGMQDDDANLSPEALRRKYADALDKELPVASESDNDEVDHEESDSDDSSGSGTESDETAESDADDEDEEEEPSLLSLMLPKTARPKLDPDQILDKSEGEVDSKMDSSGVPDDTATPTPVETPQIELEEVDDILMDDSEAESTDMDDDEDSEESGSDNEASASGSEVSDEETGLMGFFAKPKKKPLAENPSEPAETGAEDKDVPMTNGHLSTEAAEDNDEVEEIEYQRAQLSDLTRRSASQPSTPRTPHTLADVPRIEVPTLLMRGNLREYQHDGLDWLAKLYSGGRNGILADEMGLGKTIQTISLLAHLAVEHKIWGPHLIVVPTSVMLNWEMEFKKWLPGFKILTYYGDIEDRKRKRQGWLNDDKWNVCIASYQLILKDAQAFKKRSWHYLVLDEAHYIKNFQSQKWQTLLTFKTHSRLLLTGTPLQNDLQELWSLLYFLMPAGLDGSGGFADLEKFLNSMKRPADQILNQGQQKLDAEAQARVHKLHEVLRPFLLRRLKSEVEKQMPGKYEHVVYCRLSKRQRQLYDEFMSRSDTKRTLAGGNYMSIMNCLMSLRKVCNHPDLFETRQIVTSFAMPKSAIADYEIQELFVRKRLLQAKEQVDLERLSLIPTAFEKHSRLSQFRRYHLRALEPLQGLVERQSRRLKIVDEVPDGTINGSLKRIEHDAQIALLHKLRSHAIHSRRTTDQWPIYGTDFVQLMTMPDRFFPRKLSAKQLHRRDMGDWFVSDNCLLLQKLMPTLPTVAKRYEPLVTKFACLTPAVVAEELKDYALTAQGKELVQQAQAHFPFFDPYHEARIRSSIAFPDKRLLQYDCGKLQALANLLRDLQSGGHRCLIFTQMTKVLDILEQFLNIHGHRYLRLDGATKIEQRQILTDRFNNDTRILAFILSSRSGGLGINLTGADTVIFYDLDWNPAMDAQCQDRCHRIGQTRDVHIYRFVSEHTIEANILRKSNQKRLLDDVIIQKGGFTTDTFNSRVTYRDAFAQGGEEEDQDVGKAVDKVLGEVAGLGNVLDSVEDRDDAIAAKEAQKEAIFTAKGDEDDFNDSGQVSGAGVTNTRVGSEVIGEGAEEKGPVDEWMVRYLDGYEMVGWGLVYPKAVAARMKKNGKRGRDRYRKR